MECIPKALILEDEKLKYDLKKLLVAEGFKINIARSVKHLIKLAMEDHFDASIIDIKLSNEGTEGFDAIEKLRYIKPNIYIEVLTAYKEFGQRSIELGADQISFKPGGINGLAKRIRRGILEKEFSNFQYGMLKDQMALLNTPEIENNSHNSAKTALNINFLSKCITGINTQLDKLSSNTELTQQSINLIKKEVEEVMLRQLTEENKIKNNDNLQYVDPRLAGDINYSGFIDNYNSLKLKYPDMYVAFVNGKFYKANINIAELHKDLDRFHPKDNAFIKKITKHENIISLVKPRRILKN